MPQTIFSVLELSRGSTWEPSPALPPYLSATPGDPWPFFADAYVVFTDTSGGQLARFDADTVSPDAIRFIVAADQVDVIPAGANFEIFIDGDNGPVKIRYGKVVRREVEYPDSPATQAQTIPLQFTDTFPTLGLRSDWIKFGAPVVQGNGSFPNSVGPAQILLPGSALAAIRWAQELNSDTNRMKVRLLDHASSLPAAWYSYTTVIVAADARLTTGLAAQFIHDSTLGSILRLGTLNGSPYDVEYEAGPVAAVIPPNGDYGVYYDASGDTLGVYAGANTAPIASWTDDQHRTPHGPGYRHFGVSFKCSQLNSGIQLTYISAKDDV